VRSAECEVRSAKCEVRSGECGVRSAKCGVNAGVNAYEGVRNMTLARGKAPPPRAGTPLEHRAR